MTGRLAAELESYAAQSGALADWLTGVFVCEGPVRETLRSRA